MTAKSLIKTTKAMPKVPRKLARRGEFNILWAIVAVVGIALALIMIFYVIHGAMPSLGASNTLTVTAEELGGVLVVNMKAMGVSATKITGVQLLPSGSCTWTAYLNGQQQNSFTLPITLNPGDTLSLVCTNPPSGVTEVEVVTTTGTYTAPIS
jgi:hypothetical protein